MNIKLKSFGHKYGIPKADIVFSAKHVLNPYYNSKLKELNGTSEEIQDFVLKTKKGKELLERVYTHILNHEGDEISIAVGCTGGKHRSVAIVERLAEMLEDTHEIEVTHRDIGRK